MPPVIFAPAALRDLQRLREFLRPKPAGRTAGCNNNPAVPTPARSPTLNGPPHRKGQRRFVSG